MLSDVAAHFPNSNIVVVSDSRFGNDGLWKPLHKELGKQAHMLSRPLCNSNLLQAERGLPMAKVKQQISVCFRGDLYMPERTAGSQATCKPWQLRA